MTEQQTIASFIDRHAVTMTAQQIDARPDSDGRDSEWDKTASHWLVTITISGRSFSTCYSLGAAHRIWKKRREIGPLGCYSIKGLSYAEAIKLPPVRPHYAKETMAEAEARRAWTTATPPELPDVLDSLRSDCSSIDNARDFEEWAPDLGYDTDSRKAEATYRACQDLRQKVYATLGREAYADLMECEGL